MSAGKGFYGTAILVAVIVVIAAAIGISGCGKSQLAEITAFGVNGMKVVDVAAVKNGGSVEVEVPYGTDVTKLLAAICTSPKTTVEPKSSGEFDFSKPVTFTVTSENKKTVNKLTVTVKTAPNTEAEVKSFDFLGLEKWTPQPDGNTVTIDAVAKYGTDIQNLAPTFDLSDGAIINPASGTKQNFSEPKVYVVTAQDGKTTKEYTVKVTVAAPAKTVTISVGLNDYDADVDTTAHTVRVELPDEEKLDAVVVTSLGGTFGKIEPKLAVGDTLNFSDGAKKFTLVAQDTTVCENWTIAVFHPMVTDLEKAVIGKGEGVEHALARQVVLSPVFWGYVGSLSDPVALKEWKGVKADQTADSTGYIDRKIGKQVGVKKAGVLYVLGKNDEGKITVTEYAEMPKDADTKPTDIKVAGAKFEGADTEHLQSDYEYIFPLSTLSTCPSPSLQECNPATGVQQSGGGEEEINFPTVPVPVWPAGIPI